MKNKKLKGFNKLDKIKQKLVKSMIKAGFNEKWVIKFVKTVHYKNIASYGYRRKNER